MDICFVSMFLNVFQESLVGLLSEQRGSWVKVNAGGREFLTTRETLTKLAASPLAAMLQPGQQQLQLDCDPREFEVILTYLRRYKESHKNIADRHCNGRRVSRKSKLNCNKQKKPIQSVFKPFGKSFDVAVMLMPFTTDHVPGRLSLPHRLHSRQSQQPTLAPI